MIKIQAQYTLEDFKTAQRLHLQVRRGALSGFPAIAVWLAALMLVLSAGSLVVADAVDWYALIFPFALLLALGYSFVVARPRQIARMFLQQKELSAPFDLELSEEGFDLSYLYGRYRIPWADFVKWKENAELILLYRSELMINFVPKRLLAGADQLAYVHQLLEQGGVPDAFKTDRRTWIGRIVAYLLIFLAVCILTVYFVLRTTP